MKEAKHHVSRTGFQLERFSFFSDGVFAICITLLVIEIKVPEGLQTDKALLHYLSETALKFLGFLISFCLIGHYWIIHHRIFGYVKRSTNALLWINLFFLLCIVMLPFSSGLVGEYVTEVELTIPYLTYVINMIVLGLVNCWLWLYVSNPKLNLLTHKISPARIRLGVYRSLIVPIIFFISFLITFLSPVVARFIPILIPIILNWGMKGLELKANTTEDTEDNEESFEEEHH